MSGHISAQRAHPVHFSSSLIPAGSYPFWLYPCSTTRIFLGQNVMQSLQPLHRSLSITILAIFECPILLTGFGEAPERLRLRNSHQNQ